MTEADGTEKVVKFDGLDKKTLTCIRLHPNMTRNRLQLSFTMDK